MNAIPSQAGGPPDAREVANGAGTTGQPKQTRTRSPDPKRVATLRTYVIVLIAVIAAVAAVTTWLAEVAGTQAAHSNQQGVAVDIGAAGAKLNARLDNLGGAQRVITVQTLSDEETAAIDRLSGAADTLSGYAGTDQVVASEPPPAAPSHDTADALVAAQTQEWELRSSWYLNNYVNPPDAAGRLSLNLESAVADEVTAMEVPVNYESYFRRSEGSEHHRLRLLYIDLALVAALALAAVAHVLKPWKPMFGLAATSTLIFATSIALLAVLEV